MSIATASMNGHESPLRGEEGALKLDVRIAASSSIEVLIPYGN